MVSKDHLGLILPVFGSAEVTSLFRDNSLLLAVSQESSFALIHQDVQSSCVHLPSLSALSMGGLYARLTEPSTPL